MIACVDRDLGIRQIGSERSLGQMLLRYFSRALGRKEHTYSLVLGWGPRFSACVHDAVHRGVDQYCVIQGVPDKKPGPRVPSILDHSGSNRLFHCGLSYS